MTPIRLVEDKIVRHLVKRILKAGYRVAVSLERGYDIDEMLLGSTDEEAIIKEAFAGDEAHLFIQDKDGPTVLRGSVVSSGWIYIVLGNSGWDVICDYTTNLEKIVGPTMKFAEKFCK